MSLRVLYLVKLPRIASVLLFWNYFHSNFSIVWSKFVAIMDEFWFLINFLCGERIFHVSIFQVSSFQIVKKNLNFLYVPRKDFENIQRTLNFNLQIIVNIKIRFVLFSLLLYFFNYCTRIWKHTTFSISKYYKFK